MSRILPEIDSSVFVADGAKIIGNVKIGAESSVWYNSVIRSDMDGAEVIIGERTNIQDGSIIHNDTGYSTKIGDNVTVGHNCIIHGCIIEDECIIGMGSIVLKGSVIKTGSIIGAGSLVKEKYIVDENTLVLGSPARVVRKLNYENRKYILENASKYIELAEESIKNLL